MREIIFTLEEIVPVSNRYSSSPVYTVQTVKGYAKVDFQGNVLECQIDNISVLDEVGNPRKQLAFTGTINRLKNVVSNILLKIRE